MASLQTAPISAMGGLDLMSTPQQLALKGGWAVRLNNYEALIEGGYRRINGFTSFAPIPQEYGLEPIRGLACYKGGVVVALGDSLLYCNDGATWLLVNRDNATATPSIDMPNLAKLPRLGKGRVNFDTLNLNGKEVLVISDDVSELAVLTVDDDKYTYELATDNVKGFRFVAHYQDHVVAAGSLEEPGKVALSTRFTATDFSGSGSWGVQVQDEITGLHVFRDFLYIFCRNSIHRVSNLENKEQVAVRPVTTKMGCVDGASIQEIGGDIMFLAADGLRYLGATERIDDVSINTVSDFINEPLQNIDFVNATVNSMVLTRKAQYRLFYRDTQGSQRGIIGTMMSNGSFAWSTTSDLSVSAIDSAMEGPNEVAYHIGSQRYGTLDVYRHDVGDDFNGTPILAEWKTPWFHLGDSAVRKRLHDMEIYLDTEGKASLKIEVAYDHNNPKVLQPEPFYLEPLTSSSIWGDFKWGQALYGTIVFPLDSLFLEGSGKWVQIAFSDAAEDNTSYTIRGFDLHVTTGGRI